jgi:hypothetical protein
MENNKEIRKIIKDKLSNLNASPSDDLWNKIEEELNQKKKKRRALFWSFFTPFLAGSIFTLLLVYSTNWMNSDSNNQKNSNATQNNSNTSSSSNLNIENSKSNNQNFTNNSNNNIVNSTQESTSANNNQKNTTSENIELKNKSISNRNRVNSIFKNNNSNSIKKNSKKNFTNDAFKFESNTNSKLSEHKNKKQSKKKNYNPINEISIISDSNDFSVKDIIGTNIDQTESKIDTVITIIALQETKDTLAIAATSKNKNKKLEPEKEKDSTEVKPKVKTNPFIVSSYYGTGLFPKNQVKGNFNSNNLVASKNEQYGVIFRWMTNQYYGLQIGIGYINTSTQTEIEKTNSNTLVFNDVNNNSGVTFPSTNKLMMHHNLSMYEIPLEFYYKLSDKKIGFALSSGISHTIIKDNSVSIDTADGTIKIGSLESLNKSNFTANLKFYSHYKFSDKLQFEVYPSFQYQLLKTIKSKDLNSTIFSIRAGIAYKF